MRRPEGIAHELARYGRAGAHGPLCMSASRWASSRCVSCYASPVRLAWPGRRWQNPARLMMVRSATPLVFVSFSAISGWACASPPRAPSPKVTVTDDHAAAARAQAAPTSLLGTQPSEWSPELWMNSPPLRLSDLRGKVVLVRWWTADCPFCSASAPALRAFHETYGPQGLVVVGMYHHKGDGPFVPGVYEDTAKKYGLPFPL